MTTNPTETDEMSIAEASKKFDVNRRTLQRATERGTIPSRKIANVYMVDVESVRLFAQIQRAREALAAHTGRDAGEA